MVMNGMNENAFDGPGVGEVGCKSPVAINFCMVYFILCIMKRAHSTPQQKQHHQQQQLVTGGGRSNVNWV